MTFYPVSATVAGWEEFLLNVKNLKKDVTVLPAIAPLETVVTLVNFLTEPQVEVAERAVQAIINRYPEVLQLEDDWARPIAHPLLVVPRLSRPRTAPRKKLEQAVARLWTEFPGTKSYDDDMVRQLFAGLGAALPEDNDFVVDLYRNYFDAYCFQAITTLLLRGEYELANSLFQERAGDYGNFDPGTFDHLVVRGLPVDAVVLWLDQSVNAKPGYEYHYSSALERWPKQAEQFQARQKK